MKNLTSKNLSKNLLKYGALTSAIIGVTDANGQIEYTDISDETINSGEDYAMDLNNDGTGDYTFLATANSANSVFGAIIAPVSSASAASFNANSFVGTQGSYAYPSNLTSGAMVDQNVSFVGGAVGTMNFDSCAYPGSQFCDGQDGFIGLRFEVAGNTHYGWVRVQVASDATSITIKDFAYNATPDQSIQAGQQTLGIDDETFKGFTYLTDADNNLVLSANMPMNNVSIYNIAGQQVINNKVSTNETSINLNNLSTGVYIAKVEIEGKTKSFKFSR